MGADTRRRRKEQDTREEDQRLVGNGWGPGASDWSIRGFSPAGFPSPGSPGPDAVFAGTEQPETLSGTNANDLIEGLGGGDYLNDLWGHDALFGEEGDDLVCWTRHDSCEIGNPPQRGVI
jgi:Ca2+-binding RTX toxin-like protein